MRIPIVDNIDFPQRTWFVAKLNGLILLSCPVNVNNPLQPATLAIRPENSS